MSKSLRSDIRASLELEERGGAADSPLCRVADEGKRRVLCSAGERSNRGSELALALESFTLCTHPIYVFWALTTGAGQLSPGPSRQQHFLTNFMSFNLIHLEAQTSRSKSALGFPALLQPCAFHQVVTYTLFGQSSQHDNFCLLKHHRAL